MPIEVKYIQHMGTDRTPYNAARTSFDGDDWEPKETLGKRERRVIHLLASSDPPHWTPFGHIQITLGLQAPIYIARQLMTSKVGYRVTEEGFTFGEEEYTSTDDFARSEVSRRVTSQEPTFTLPTVWRTALEKRGMGSGGPIPEEMEISTKAAMAYVVQECVRAYNAAIADGIAPEQARMILPQCMDTRWIWTGSIEAWARVCRHRLGGNAQEETQLVASLINDIISPLFPFVWSELVLV